MSQILNVAISDWSAAHGGANSAMTNHDTGPLPTETGPNVLEIVVVISLLLTNSL